MRKRLPRPSRDACSGSRPSEPSGLAGPQGAGPVQTAQEPEEMDRGTQSRPFAGVGKGPPQ